MNLRVSKNGKKILKSLKKHELFNMKYLNCKNKYLVKDISNMLIREATTIASHKNAMITNRKTSFLLKNNFPNKTR